MSTGTLQIGDRVHMDGNWLEGTVRAIDTTKQTADVWWDGDTVHEVPIRKLRIILGYGVSRDKAEHDLAISDYQKTIAALKEIEPQIERAIIAERLGEAYEVIEAFGLRVPAVATRMLSTAKFASNFVELLIKDEKVDPVTRRWLKIMIESTRLASRTLRVT